MEDTLAVPRQLNGTALLDAAVSYARSRHWEVLPGTWLETDAGGAPRCSCASAACPAPGAHPTRADWATQASGSGSEVRRMWTRQPRSSVLLPTGRTFDVLEVPESAGFHALARTERMEVALGPVVSTPTGRMAFFVLPGAGARVPRLLAALGWPRGAPDLTVRGEGDWVAAPPTRMGRGGRVQWARRPTDQNRWLPDVGEVLSPLAYACGREAAEARAGR
ncbi:bifunctional DNA primase/polymerase [Actinacidiphila reveromycinica]|uniref:bifunctional DNA primase/polymerase n=1 Tax=Actinacidiphila reveromycinica TaxID=659352 RepID=UPI001F26EFE8|nr:bifunctional DNA primase/polymerase [Streptomyces sp. SN-593]